MNVDLKAVQNALVSVGRLTGQKYVGKIENFVHNFEIYKLIFNFNNFWGGGGTIRFV